jgi:excisionase family DNA binding protein
VRLAADQARRLDEAAAATGKTKRQLVEDAVRRHLSFGGVAPREPGTEVLTPGEAAELLRVDERELLAEATAGEVPGRAIGGEWRFSRPALLAWLGHEGASNEPAARVDEVIDTGLEYAPGDPVQVRVARRGRRISVTDDGAAVERAGRPQGWRAVADRLAAQLVVNIGRHGGVGLPVVPVGPGEDAIVRRIGDASLALYQELLELESAE